MTAVPLVGVTGGIGSGKSLLCRFLSEERGLPVIDADRLGHLALHPGTATAKRVLRRFGPGVLDADGRIDRARLGGIVFRDPAALADLDAIVHPWILSEIRRRVEGLKVSGSAVMILLEAALLPVWRTQLRTDAMVVVRAPRDLRLARLKERGLSEEDALRRIQAQEGTEEDALPAATDWVVDNDGTTERLRTLARDLWSALADRFGIGKEPA